MRVEVRKLRSFGWTWSCPVCHYGYNVPWQSCDTWTEAMTAAAVHIVLHRTTGQRLEWAPVRIGHAL